MLSDGEKAEILSEIEYLLDMISVISDTNPGEDGPLGGGLGDEIYQLVIKRLEK